MRDGPPSPGILNYGEDDADSVSALSIVQPVRCVEMAVVDTNPTRIDGPWVEGFVLDRHVISSYPIGYIGDHMQFDTTRSALGELIYQLKYRNGSVDDIVDTAEAFVTERWPGAVDGIVLPPPSLHRARQPMRTIAD